LLQNGAISDCALRPWDERADFAEACYQATLRQ